jgi:hypothetical protein
MSRIAILLLLLGSVAITGCAPCYDWALKPKLDYNEFAGRVRVMPLSSGQCVAREEERKQLADAHVCTQLEQRWNLDICWDHEDWDDYERGEDEHARTGELPDA